MIWDSIDPILRFKYWSTHDQSIWFCNNFLIFFFNLGFNLPFIFNRIKPGQCPEDSPLLGNNPATSICETQCKHDYDCDGQQLCVYKR
jgi:hypothetical protein